MRKIILLFLILCSVKLTAQTKEIMVCGDTQVLIVKQKSATDSIPEVIWNWNANLAHDLPEAYAKNHFRNIDECKAVEGGKKILITSSGGGVALINKIDKKVLFYAYVPNAHSAEVLPNNRLAVAGSGTKISKGNCISVFDLDSSESLLFSDTLYQAHGVIWDQERQVLYSLGFHSINQYQLSDWNTRNPKLIKKKIIQLPSEGGHELQRGLGEQQLLITTNAGVYIFNKSSEKFEVFAPLKSTKMVKSISVKGSGAQIIFTKAETSWWTHRIYFLPNLEFLSFPTIKVYKAHWLL